MEENLKKSAVDLTDLALGIVVLGIVVSIGATILVSTRDSRLTDLSVVTTNNETITQSNTATLANTWGKSVVAVTNATGGNLYNSGNYSVSVNSVSGAMTVNNVTSTEIGSWNVTYQWYNTSRADWSVANKSALGLGEYGNWFKIIVIVGVAAVVLALIFSAFGNKGQAGSVAY